MKFSFRKYKNPSSKYIDYMLLVDGKIACVIDSSLGAPIKEHWYISYCKHDKPPVAYCYSVGKDNWHFIANTLVEAKRKLVEIYCTYNKLL